VAVDEASAAHLAEIARRRAHDIGPSVPKTRAAAILGVSLTTLDKWIGRGALPVVRRTTSSREELQTEGLLELADQAHDLRERGLDRAVLATAIRARHSAARQTKPKMGTRGYFPCRSLDRRHDLELTAGERVAQGIELTRAATRIALAGRKAASRHD
jgi:hypothetical protein